MDAHSPITVAITRFPDLLALGLRAALADDPSVSVVAEDIELSRIGVVLQAHRPGVLIVDADELIDLATVRDLSVEHPGTLLVLLADGLSTLERSQLLALGAGVCLDKQAQARDVRNAIHLVTRGLQLMTRAPVGGPARPARGVLTQRESDVLLLLRENRSNAQIALELQIGVETVRTHARSVYRKLGVPSRRALVSAR
jgi:DNA-binding NarL/FixJ family response regulator